jgi:hypothetical protein
MMGEKYYIVYNPVTYNRMKSIGECNTPLDLLSDITNKNGPKNTGVKRTMNPDPGV